MSEWQTPFPEREKAVRDSRRRNYLWIDNEFIVTAARVVGPAAVAVYALLCRHADNESQLAWPAVPTIAEVLAMSEPTVIKALKALALCGIIEIKHRFREDGSQQSNFYRLIDVTEWNVDAGRAILRGGKGDLPPSKNGLPQGQLHLPPDQNGLSRGKNGSKNGLPQGKNGGKGRLPKQEEVEEHLPHKREENSGNNIQHQQGAPAAVVERSISSTAESAYDYEPLSEQELEMVRQIAISARLPVSRAERLAKAEPANARVVIARWGSSDKSWMESPPAVLTKALKDWYDIFPEDLNQPIAPVPNVVLSAEQQEGRMRKRAEFVKRVWERLPATLRAAEFERAQLGAESFDYFRETFFREADEVFRELG